MNKFLSSLREETVSFDEAISGVYFMRLQQSFAPLNDGSSIHATTPESRNNIGVIAC